jgi:hypothetical protein
MMPIPSLMKIRLFVRKLFSEALAEELDKSDKYRGWWNNDRMT